MRYTALSALLLVATTVSASVEPLQKQEAPLQLQLVDVAKFVEGFLYGVI